MEQYHFPDVFLVTQQQQQKDPHEYDTKKNHFSNDLKLLLEKLRILSFVNQLSTLSTETKITLSQMRTPSAGPTVKQMFDLNNT